LSGFAGLMSDDPKQVQDVGVIGCGLQNLLIKPARLRQSSGTMVIQRLPEQMVIMLDQGLSPTVVRGAELLALRRSVSQG
jgi:hypothetical protein